ncbi:hypothetical protein PV774_20065, partial [Pseudomonas sp. LP23]
MQQSQKQIYFYAPEGLSLVKYVGAEASALVRAAGRTLAQRDDVQAALYAADLQGSVQGCIGRNATNLMHYTAYGWDSQNTVRDPSSPHSNRPPDSRCCAPDFFLEP